MNRFLSAVIVSLVGLFTALPADAACYFLSLREFQVAEGADPFSKGDFMPFIALEPGRVYPLAPERMIEAPEGSLMEGRRYYLPRHLFEDQNRVVLWITLFDFDQDTPNDLILPQTGGSIRLDGEQFTRAGYLASVDFLPFTDIVPGKPNAQRFTFHIERTDGACDSDSTAGRAEDRRLRQENELRRLQARVQHYQRYPVGGQEYHAYRVNRVQDNARPAALDKAFDLARGNALELIALGEALYRLRELRGYGLAWDEYRQLLQTLLEQTIPYRYRDEKGVRQQASVPSLAFHPAWRNLPNPEQLPELRPEWGISLTAP